MKKLFLVIFSLFLVACGSSVSVKDISAKMPMPTEQRKSIIFNVPSSGQILTTDAIYMAKLKTVGSEQLDKLVKVLSLNNIDLGISGQNPALNKTMILLALEQAPAIGNNLELYIIGSDTDKKEFEKLTQQRKIKLHYFIGK